MPDQRFFQFGLGVLVLKIEELQHEGIFDGSLRTDKILWLSSLALRQHLRLVQRKRGALVELALTCRSSCKTDQPFLSASVS